MAEQTAAIVTIGAELTAGLRVDTNTAEIARALYPRGFRVVEALSIPDDASLLAATIRRLVAEYDLVVTTGGLGPTHDDVTREAAAQALGRSLRRDTRIEALLAPTVLRHYDPKAASQVLVQADIIEGARVIDPITGTAPGLIVDLGAATLALLPGPPSEMRPMLAVLLADHPLVRAEPLELGVVGLTESDAQVMTERALAGASDIGFTVLARPGDVRVILGDEGVGATGLKDAAARVVAELGEYCYSADGASLAEVVVSEARSRAVTLAAAESCTGGLLSAALTDVPGASECFLGSVVSYSNEAKAEILDVPYPLLAQYGAVSEECAKAMAEGARRRFAADVAVAITGIAGPGGGTADKPAGLVWFAVAHAEGTGSLERRFPAGSRDAVRARAASTALDLLRREVLSR